MVNNKMIVTIMLIAAASLVVAGCSDDNPANPATIVDNAPPAVPANLNAEFSSNLAVVSWDMSTVDPDLAGYIVIRERYGVSETLIGTPALISSFEDNNPLPGTSLYHVYSVDTSGNESAVSTVTLVITYSHDNGDLTQ